jgi:helicase MOV-10
VVIAGGIYVYRGYTFKVALEKIYLNMHDLFHKAYINQHCAVQFTVNRGPLNRMHQAIGNYSFKMRKLTQTEESGILHSFLFPSKTMRVPLLLNWKPFNKYLNKEQENAVKQILGRPELSGKAPYQTGPAPYIIFGPPGTGKTITVVEAILQTFYNNPKSRILACAPSNAAADILVDRISKVVHSNKELVRINAFSRDVSAIPNHIKHYSKTVAEADNIAQHSIVVVTCVSSGSLDCRFTHIFIDECGHACEPEALVAIAGGSL